MESKLATKFDNAMSLGGPKPKNSEPLLSTPGKLSLSEASRQKKKDSLTERLHRGTQASVKLGRRQLYQRDVFKYGETPYQNEESTPTLGQSTRLGKRNFIASQLPMTPAPDYRPATPLYAAAATSKYHKEEPQTPLYGL